MSILKKFFSKTDKSEYEYFIDNLDAKELDLCKIGDELIIWFPEDKTMINLYRTDADYGKGKVGNITGKFMNVVLQHFDRGDIVTAKIVEIAGRKCKILCSVKAAKQIQAEKDDNISNIREEISKPYSPKKPLKHILYSKKDFDLQPGDSFSFQLDNLEEIEANLERIEIPILHNGNLIGTVTAQSICQKILRAIYSGYSVHPRVVDIEKQEKNLKVVKYEIEFKCLAANP